MATEAASAGELLRDARRRSGLTQRQVATRAGVTQSVVAAYESGRRKPAFETLLRLLAATGHRAEIDLVGDAPGAPMAGELGLRVRAHRDEIVTTAAAHGAGNVRVFGSVARGDDQRGSDIDLLVDLARPPGLLTLMRLERELAALLGVDVEVIPADSLKADVRATAEREAVTL